MGFFGTYLFDGHRWCTHQPDDPPTIAEPWLLVDIHDGDITTVTYRHAGTGSGTAYLGQTPRTYFENPAASAPTDVTREAAGLSEWWAGHGGGAERRATQAQLSAYLAPDLDLDQLEFDEDDTGDDLHDADIFMEVKTARFLALFDR